MAQIVLKIPEKQLKLLRARAKARKLSLKSYLVRIVTGDIHPDWPPGYFENVAGAWKDSGIERPEQGEYEKREPR